MGAGSLRDPRECDDRLPPDAGYYLDLAIPRFEEPPKKIGSRVRLLHGEHRNRVINYMHPIPEISNLTSK
jgi:hypothetical protein